MSAYNITPTRTNDSKGCPFNLWKLQPASYTSNRAFGCKVLQLITGPSQGGKLSEKASLCIYLYPLPDGDGCSVWDTHLRREVKTHNTVVYEDEFPGVTVTSKQTHTNWFTWSSTMYDRTAAIPNTTRLRALWNRRLSTSIHNPSNRLPEDTPDDN